VKKYLFIKERNISAPRQARLEKDGAQERSRGTKTWSVEDFARVRQQRKEGRGEKAKTKPFEVNSSGDAGT